MAPLYWADAPASLLSRIYDEVRDATPGSQDSGGHAESIVRRQEYLRRVSAAYHARRRAERSYAEGVDCSTPEPITRRTRTPETPGRRRSRAA